MNLIFSDLIPFETLIDNPSDPGLKKGGIYMAFAVEEIDNKIIAEKLLYIGKAESPSNSLGKRIKEHGDVQSGKFFSDHGMWRLRKYVDKFQKIAYCYAPLDDITHIEEIEMKLIFINQPCANSQNKDRDNSSIHCPSIEISTPFNSNVNGYSNTLTSYLQNILKK